MSKPDIYLVITIDTEADHSLNWAKSNPLTFKSVTESIPAILEPLFKKYGAVATYLLTTEVLQDSESIKAIKTLGECELGAHLHPEYIEPDRKYYESAGTYARDFSNNYPPDIEREKIHNLTRLFEKRVGYRPAVYRGGKFGFDNNTALSLANLGYLVDTSVTPRVSWRNIGGPDFRAFPDQPYFIKDSEGSNALLEVPVSILFLNSIAKLLNKPVWLRPSFNSPAEMKKLMQSFIKIYRARNTVVLNMMFHSMEFYPGASPYTKNKEECERLARSLEIVIHYCKQIGVKFCKLSQVRTLYD